MKSVALMLALSALLTGTAFAEQQVFKGAGTTTCGKFAANYRTSPDVFEGSYFTWAQGYMSGMNAHFYDIKSPGQVRNLNGWTTESQQSFVRDYCDKHPLKYYFEAVSALFWTLPKVSQGVSR